VSQRSCGATRCETISKRFHGDLQTVAAALAIGGVFWLTGCASSRPRIVLEPGVQVTDATIDWQAGSVTLEREGVVVSAQGAMLPSPRGSVLHPTFWVTVENYRDERIAVRPTDARLVDTFGKQLEPLPMTVDRSGREVRYALVDPQIRTYVSLHYGWPYYPLYPYPDWLAYPRYGRVRYWHADPFWTFGFRPIWITEVRAVRPQTPPVRDEVELVYSDAKRTYVVIFPELAETARNVRLIIPEIAVREVEGGQATLEFELIFEQIMEGR
jgi:hypothetical protein